MSDANVLLKDFTGTKISFRWWNQHKQIETGTHTGIADFLEAEHKSISTRKKIYSEAIPAISAANSVKNAITKHWQDNTLPYPERGIRLLRNSELITLNNKMTELQAKLQHAIVGIQNSRTEIIDDARKRLKKAFSEANYPLDLTTLFGFEWSFPILNPVHGQLPPEIYEAERQRAYAQMVEAIKLAEQAFAEELHKLVTHLAERLTPNGDKPKIFHDSAIENLKEFFTKFQKMNVVDSETLDKAVAEAKQLLIGVNAQELRSTPFMKASLQTGMEKVASRLEGLIVARPRRKILA